MKLVQLWNICQLGLIKNPVCWNCGASILFKSSSSQRSTGIFGKFIQKFKNEKNTQSLTANKIGNRPKLKV